MKIPGIRLYTNHFGIIEIYNYEMATCLVGIGIDSALEPLRDVKPELLRICRMITQRNQGPPTRIAVVGIATSNAWMSLLDLLKADGCELVSYITSSTDKPIVLDAIQPNAWAKHSINVVLFNAYIPDTFLGFVQGAGLGYPGIRDDAATFALGGTEPLTPHGQLLADGLKLIVQPRRPHLGVHWNSLRNVWNGCLEDLQGHEAAWLRRELARARRRLERT